MPVQVAILAGLLFPIALITVPLYIMFISMASAHHLLVDPGFSSAWKIVNTSYFMYLSLIHI